MIIRRLTTALFIFPTITNLLELILPLTGLTILLLFIGFQSDFLKLHILEKSWQEIVKIIVFSFFIPGLNEEIVFRVLFLPHPTENPSLKIQIIWMIIT